MDGTAARDLHPIESSVFDVAGVPVCVGASSGRAADAVRAVMRGFAVRPASEACVARYELVESPDAWHVLEDGRALYTDAAFPPALGALEWNVTTAALARRDDVLQLHGASLCSPMQRAALLIVGDSGQGKTTLTLALMLRGFAAFGDDIVLVEPERLHVQPLPRSFHVSADTWPLLRPLAGGQPRSDADDPEGYFAPPQIARTAVPVRWVLFLDRQPGAVPALHPQPPAESSRRLLAQTFNLSRAPRLALTTCGRITARAACYRFVTGDLAASVAAVQALVTGVS